MLDTSKMSFITRQQSSNFIDFQNFSIFSNFLSCYVKFGNALRAYFWENLNINWVK